MVLFSQWFVFLLWYDEAWIDEGVGGSWRSSPKSCTGEALLPLVFNGACRNKRTFVWGKLHCVVDSIRGCGL